MKTFTFYILLSALLTSCAGTYNEIGSLSMLSNKHLDPSGHYQKLALKAGTSKKEIRQSKADNMEAAINQVISQIPGAEYMTNVKIYAVKGNYLAVSGDVWGNAVKNISTNSEIKTASIAK